MTAAFEKITPFHAAHVHTPYKNELHSTNELFSFQGNLDRYFCSTTTTTTSHTSSSCFSSLLDDSFIIGDRETETVQQPPPSETTNSVALESSNNKKTIANEHYSNMDLHIGELPSPCVSHGQIHGGPWSCKTLIHSPFPKLDKTIQNQVYWIDNKSFVIYGWNEHEGFEQIQILRIYVHRTRNLNSSNNSTKEYDDDEEEAIAHERAIAKMKVDTTTTHYSCESLTNNKTSFPTHRDHRIGVWCDGEEFNKKHSFTNHETKKNKAISMTYPEYYNSMYVFDEPTGNWELYDNSFNGITPISTMQYASCNLRLKGKKDYIYIYGGITKFPSQQKDIQNAIWCLDLSEKQDPKKSRWRCIPVVVESGPSHGLYGHSMLSYQNRYLIVFGGYDSITHKPSSNIWKFDTVEEKWTLIIHNNNSNIYFTQTITPVIGTIAENCLVLYPPSSSTTTSLFVLNLKKPSKVFQIPIPLSMMKIGENIILTYDHDLKKLILLGGSTSARDPSDEEKLKDCNELEYTTVYELDYIDLVALCI